MTEVQAKSGKWKCIYYYYDSILFKIAFFFYDKNDSQIPFLSSRTASSYIKSRPVSVDKVNTACEVCPAYAAICKLTHRKRKIERPSSSWASVISHPSHSESGRETDLSDIQLLENYLCGRCCQNKKLKNKNKCGWGVSLLLRWAKRYIVSGAEAQYDLNWRFK